MISGYFLLIAQFVFATGVKDVKVGQALYLKYGCAACHGKEGYGDGPIAKRLYSLPTNFHVPKSYLVGPSAQEMKSVIRKGFKVDGSTMPAFENIPEHELGQIVTFLLSLQEHHEEK